MKSACCPRHCQAYWERKTRQITTHISIFDFEIFDKMSSSRTLCVVYGKFSKVKEDSKPRPPFEKLPRAWAESETKDFCTYFSIFDRQVHTSTLLFLLLLFLLMICEVAWLPKAKVAKFLSQSLSKVLLELYDSLAIVLQVLLQSYKSHYSLTSLFHKKSLARAKRARNSLIQNFFLV